MKTGGEKMGRAQPVRERLERRAHWVLVSRLEPSEVCWFLFRPSHNMSPVYLDRSSEGSSVEWKAVRQEQGRPHKGLCTQLLGSKSSQVQYQGLFNHASVSKWKT